MPIPALRDAYFAVDDPLRWYGLPTSRVITYEHVHTIRLQRAVLQQWLVDLPWASAGEVTVANGGALARGAGIFPVCGPRARGQAPRRRIRAAVDSRVHPEAPLPGLRPSPRPRQPSPRPHQPNPRPQRPSRRTSSAPSPPCAQPWACPR